MDEGQSPPNKPEKQIDAEPSVPEKTAVAKPAAAKAIPPKKKQEPKKPLVDNDDGTITDPNTGLMWKKSDAWIDDHKFYDWFRHREYVDKINKEKFAGYEDWRIPSKAEALTLFDKTKKCLDKNGSSFFVDPIFEAGGAGNAWISECSDDRIVRYDWKTGIDTEYPTKDIWASMRLVRKPE